MISKELLSEITGKEIRVIAGVTSTNELKYNNDMIAQFVNVYELAHKCKEWAYENFYMVRTNYEHTIDGRMCRVSISRSCDFNEHENWFYSTCANTEPEAIFKATSYIMEQLKQKD